MKITDREKRIAWEKADPIPDKNMHAWRKDEAGHVIRFTSYEKSHGAYGWRVVLEGLPKVGCDNTCRLKAVWHKAPEES